MKRIVMTIMALLLVVGCGESSSSPDTFEPVDTWSGDLFDDVYDDLASDVMEEQDLEEPAEDVPVDTAIDTEEIPISPACEAIVENWNSGFMVDGLAREFIVTLPQQLKDGDEGPFAVVFNWHGFGDTAANMEAL